MNPYEEARNIYQPENLRLQFISESPPDPQQQRYFYFEQVRTGDSLFLEMMKVLYPGEVATFATVKALRAEKPYFLNRFRQSGFIIHPAWPESLAGHSAKKREQRYGQHFWDLTEQLDKQVPILLISATVHRALYDALKIAGYTVLNRQSIPFPNSGQQAVFRRELRRLLEAHELMPEGV